MIEEFEVIGKPRYSALIENEIKHEVFFFYNFLEKKIKKRKTGNYEKEIIDRFEQGIIFLLLNKIIKR